MPKPPSDRIGERYGDVEVVDLARKVGRHTWWLCQCACGGIAEIRGDRLRDGTKTHCGCKNKIERHGACDTAEYSHWSCMCARVRHDAAYSHLSVCERWRESFTAFLHDLGPIPSPLHSLDRIDNNKGYEPGNVRWATASEQQNNKRNNLQVPFRGEMFTVAQLEKLLGLSRQTLRSRIAAGTVLDAPLKHPFFGKRRAS